jgi:type IV secretory pathway VirB3-like protein
MTNEPRFHPVYRSLNKPLAILGVERRLFFVTLILAAAMLNFFASLRAALLVFAAFYCLARWASVTDEQILHILLNSSRFRLRYDPSKFQPFDLVRIRRDQTGQARLRITAKPAPCTPTRRPSHLSVPRSF